jgi:hypothetical protein
VSLFQRAGLPKHVNGTSTGGAAPASQEYPFRTDSTWVLVANTHATEALEVFFTQAKAAEGAGNGYTLQPQTFLSMPIETSSVWVRSTNNCTFNILVAGRG